MVAKPKTAVKKTAVKNTVANTQDIKDFFKMDYVDQASYDNLRKISSAVDGLKNSNRKVVYTVLEKNIKELIKVNQLASKVAEFTDYLHGSLDGVVANLGQNFMGSNQIPLLHKKGNFGTRSIPVASASRYINARGADILQYLFNPADKKILVKQTFEGMEIEPRFLLPLLPLLFVNGNRGVSSGFAQLIGQRDVKEIVKVLVLRLQGKTNNFDNFNQVPMFFNDFKGTVTRDLETLDAYKWIIEGCYQQVKDEIHITELPPDTKMVSYIHYLDSLQEEKKIKSFKDKCDGDDWVFEIKLDKGQTLTHEQIVKLFKLRTTQTENFTSLGSDNKIKEFKHPSEIMQHFYETKINFLQGRKRYLLQDLNTQILKKQNQYRFLELVVGGKLNIQKLTTAALIEILIKEKFDKFEDSYRYLTSMPISSMQKDTMERLAKEIQDMLKQLQDLQDRTPEALWLEDIKEFAGYCKQKGLFRIADKPVLNKIVQEAA